MTIRIGNENCVFCEDINKEPCFTCKCNECNLDKDICKRKKYCRKEKEEINR